MTPVINPWFFYWISVCNDLKFIFSIITFIITLISMGQFVAWTNNEIEKKYLKKSIYFTFLFLFLTIFIPSKNTLYQMIIAKNFTYENIELTKKEGKELINYIVEVIKEDKKDED